MEIVQNVQNIGVLVRRQRRSLGAKLRDTAPMAQVGTRFLSEFERGKPTVEFGKALSVLQAVGLDLAVVPRKATNDSTPYSQLVGTEFPYDWSNSRMDATTFILKVLQAGRFHDVLKTVVWFGLDAVSRVLPELEDDQWVQGKIIPMLARIQTGLLRARYEQQHTTS